MSVTENRPVRTGQRAVNWPGARSPMPAEDVAAVVTELDPGSRQILRQIAEGFAVDEAVALAWLVDASFGAPGAATRPQPATAPTKLLESTGTPTLPTSFPTGPERGSTHGRGRLSSSPSSASIPSVSFHGISPASRPTSSVEYCDHSAPA